MVLRFLRILLLIFSFVSFTWGLSRIDPLVLTNEGLVRGQKAADGDYSKFLGIRYATVDKENPFGASLPVQSYETIFNAYDGSIACPQDDNQGTLDCLRLNIFVPNEANTKNPLPVLVWIHGGGLTRGKAPSEHVNNLVKHGIVVVTINYRLGPYGFMCLDVPSVPGNQGLKDQQTALEWIKNNIAAFGGNPYKITLGGQSAGATSVNHHLYSTQEKLFNKAIIQSVVSQTVGTFAESDFSVALQLSEQLGLVTSDTDMAIKFLSASAPNLVIAASKKLRLNFMPCKELSFSGVDNFFDANPYTKLNENKIKNTPIIIGFTSKEAQGDSIESTFEKDISFVFDFDSNELVEAISHVKHFYLGDDALSDEKLSIFNDFRSDFFYNHAVKREITKLLAQNAGPVFEYVFSYSNSSEGAKHSDDEHFLFGSDTSGFSEQDVIVSNYIGELWANFVKNGDPSIDNIITWEPVSVNTRPYLDIDVELKMKNRFRQESMAFWDLFYENYSKNNKLTKQCTLL